MKCFYLLVVINLVATHYNCTSPMDYISHHSLHSHIPVHHYTNHTAVTIHSSTLIVLPHLHLIHSPTYKQHTSLHTLRSLVLPRLTFWAFPLYSVFPWTAYTTLTICCLPSWPCLPCDILSVCRLPRPLHCPCCWFCPAYVTPVVASDPCLFDLALLFNKAAFESNDTASSLHLSAMWSLINTKETVIMQMWYLKGTYCAFSRFEF